MIRGTDGDRFRPLRYSLWSWSEVLWVRGKILLQVFVAVFICLLEVVLLLPAERAVVVVVCFSRGVLRAGGRAGGAAAAAAAVCLLAHSLAS